MSSIFMLALRYVLLVAGTFICGYWVAQMRGYNKWVSFLFWMVCVIAYLAMSIREFRRGQSEGKKAEAADKQAEQGAAPIKHENGGVE